MTANLKTSQTGDFVVSPSLITGLYTTATSQTQTGPSQGSVSVRVLIDCTNCAAPGSSQTNSAAFSAAGHPDFGAEGVTFDARIQPLNATIGQSLTNSCLAFSSSTSSSSSPTNPVNTSPTTPTNSNSSASSSTSNSVPKSSCQPQINDLLLATTSAHTFNFVLSNVSSTGGSATNPGNSGNTPGNSSNNSGGNNSNSNSGNNSNSGSSSNSSNGSNASSNTLSGHTITVQAKIDVGQVCAANPTGTGALNCTGTTVNSGNSVAPPIDAAIFGLGSLTITPVTLSSSFNF